MNHADRLRLGIMGALSIALVAALPVQAYEAAGPAAEREAARQIDIVMDRCGWERYLFLGDLGPYGFTTHSPYGPLFFQHYYFFDADHPQFLDGFAKAMARTPLIVLGDWKLKDWNPFAKEYLSENFVEGTPACAGTIEATLEPYRLYHRSDSVQ